MDYETISDMIISKELPDYIIQEYLDDYTSFKNENRNDTFWVKINDSYWAGGDFVKSVNQAFNMRINRIPTTPTPWFRYESPIRGYGDHHGTNL